MESALTAAEHRLEKINSGLHALGVLFGLISIPILIAGASSADSPAGTTGSGIYGFSFLMVFIFSTLYHGSRQPRAKAMLKILDHISIYFLIAGTYTPIVLVFVNNNFGWTLLVVLWSLTLVGILFKIFYTGRFEIASTFIYVIMGWLLFSGGSTFFAAMPYTVIVLITAGGALYSVGVIFYLWRKFIYHHVVWHVFVLLAAICHYCAILLAVTPAGY